MPDNVKNSKEKKTDVPKLIYARCQKLRKPHYTRYTVLNVSFMMVYHVKPAKTIYIPTDGIRKSWVYGNARWSICYAIGQ
jgi:hypothetical protein